MRIRIDYHDGIEETDATHLGAFPDGAGELFRVARPSVGVGGISRDDVVRLERVGDTYVYLGVVERSSWQTHWLLLPREARGAPEAHAEFQRAIEQTGCILEDVRDGDEGPRVIISVPQGAPTVGWTRAYERLIERTSGLSAAAFRERVASDARRRAVADLERHQRSNRARHRWELVAALGRAALAALAVAGVAVVGWWIRALVTASAAERPKVAALGMIVALVPAVIGSLADRSFLPFFLGAAAAGAFAVRLGGTLSDPGHAFGAVALGVAYALVVGWVGVFIGMFSGFASSARNMRLIWLLVVAPCVASSIAAVIYAVTAARATPVRFDASPTILVAGVVVSLLLLRRPLRRRSLGSIVGVLVPLAIVWLVVWLVGGLR